jgi:flagellin
VKSTNAYAVAADAVVGGGTGAAPAITDANAKVNTSKYFFDAGTMSDSGAAQVITVTPASGGAKTINIAATDNDADMVFNKVKVALSGSGIDAVRIGSEVVFQSDADFTVARDATADAGGLGNVAASSSASAQDKAAAAGDPTVDALAALGAIATAVTRLGAVQGKVGTGQNRLQYAIQLAQSQITSFSAAESRIRDADVAQEAANLTKAQVLQQASLAALAQANSAPQAVLSLLRG